MRLFILLNLAASALGGLIAVRSTPPKQLLSRPAIHDRSLFPAISLGRYDISTSYQNEVLFDLTKSIGENENGEGVGAKVVCVDCRTWGAAIVSTTGAEQDNDIIGNIIDFFKDPEQAILDAFSVDLKLELDNVGGHFEFDVRALGALSYSIPIFQTLTPLGAAIGDDISIGIVLSVELVFSVTADVDLTAGFDFSFPENTFITVDPLTGQIKEDGFLDGQVDPIPIVVTSGTATFKAALKIKLQAGTTIELFGNGFDFQLGLFANVLEYVATISTNDRCLLEITQLLDVNLGAYAQHVISFNFISIGGSPPFITTILTVPLPSLCITAGSAARATAVPTITAGLGSATVSSRAETASITPPGKVLFEQPTPSPTSTSSLTIIDTTLQVTSVSATLPTQSALVITASANTTLSRSSEDTSSVKYANITSSIKYANSTAIYHNATSMPIDLPLITSTIHTTITQTICQCALPLINCPTSLAHQVLITSTKVLYTTVCPVGATVPNTLPASLVPTPHSSSQAGPGKNTAVGTKASLHLILLATPIVETIYEPTYVHPVHTLPTSLLPAASKDGGVDVKLIKPFATISTTASSDAQETPVAIHSYEAISRPVASAVTAPAGSGAFQNMKAVQTTDITLSVTGAASRSNFGALWWIGGVLVAAAVMAF